MSKTRNTQQIEYLIKKLAAKHGKTCDEVVAHVNAVRKGLPSEIAELRISEMRQLIHQQKPENCSAENPARPKAASALVLLHHENYIKVTAPMLARLISKHYQYFFHQLFMHRNSSQLQELVGLLENPKTERALANYISVYFPFRGELPEFSIEDVLFASDKSWFSDANVVDFSDFLLLRQRIGYISRDEMKEIMGKIRSIANWRKVLSTYLRWPSTDAPEALRSLLGKFPVATGVLAAHGYHVGQSGVTASARKKILDDILSVDLQDLRDSAGPEYIDEWGEPHSIPRLMKLANTLAALCRNARRSTRNFDLAITEWEQDLFHLKRRYYDPWRAETDSILRWPESNTGLLGESNSEG